MNVKREEDERKKESGDENKIEKFRNNVVDFLLGINREHILSYLIYHDLNIKRRPFFFSYIFCKSSNTCFVRLVLWDIFFN